MGSSKFYVPLVSGCVAGLSVDVIMFPLDTIKTRLQSRQGFLAAGGFRKIFAGIGPTVVGSAPSAALFFCTYEMIKKSLGQRVSERYAPLVHMFAAILGEMVSNILRVPFELIKQRSQANIHRKPLQLLRHTVQTEGPIGLYRGYFSTIAREVPFSLLQYPLWEYLKTTWRRSQGGYLDPWQGAVCGALAGGISASITTPLDVVKTRIMLAKTGDIETKSDILKIMIKIGKEEGISGLFSGFAPRVCWISIGGFIFLGAYDKTKDILLNTSSISI